MPRVSAWLVRSSLAWMAAGVTLGAAMLAAKGGWPAPWTGSLVRVHREVVLVGWLVQFAVGVGFWVLPPVRSGAVRERPAWAVAGLLNGGLLLFVAATLWGGGGAGAVVAAGGRALEAAAVLVFGGALLTKPFR